MHKIEEIEKALNLLDTYDGQLSKTAKALGINRYTLRSWRDKRKKGTFSISEISQNIWAMFISLILSTYSGIIGLLIKARNKNTNIKTKGTGVLISLSFFHAFIALDFIILSFVFKR